MKDPPAAMPTAVSFVIALRQWELANLPYFCEGELGQRLFLAFVIARQKKAILRLTELFVDAQASEVGVRKRLKRYEKLGLVEIVPNPADKRSKLVRPTKQLEDAIAAYFTVANALWSKQSSLPKSS